MKSSAAPAAVNMARQVKIGGHSRLYSSARTVLGRSTVRNRGGGCSCVPTRSSLDSTFYCLFDQRINFTASPSDAAVLYSSARTVLGRSTVCNRGGGGWSWVPTRSSPDLTFHCLFDQRINFTASPSDAAVLYSCVSVGSSVRTVLRRSTVWDRGELLYASLLKSYYMKEIRVSDVLVYYYVLVLDYYFYCSNSKIL